MPHSVSMLLCLVVAVAAPAPKSAAPWTAGWEKPEDPLGDCRFDRSGGAMVITVPGKGHKFHIGGGRSKATRLMRAVEGDFVIQVRVGVDLPAPGAGFREAGIVLSGAKAGAALLLSVENRKGKPRRELVVYRHDPAEGASSMSHSKSPSAGEWVHLRLGRRGNDVKMEASSDGKEWKAVLPASFGDLPKEVKGGVVAASTAEGKCRVVFDEFKLTPLK